MLPTCHPHTLSMSPVSWASPLTCHRAFSLFYFFDFWLLPQALCHQPHLCWLILCKAFLSNSPEILADNHSPVAVPSLGSSQLLFAFPFSEPSGSLPFSWPPPPPPSSPPPPSIATAQMPSYRMFHHLHPHHSHRAARASMSSGRRGCM